MDNRIDTLRTRLLTIVSDATEVHIQPPANIHLEYPCILLRRDSGFKEHANNKRYWGRKSFTVTFISTVDNWSAPDDVEDHFMFTTFDRQYESDNLYHTVLTIYY